MDRRLKTRVDVQLTCFVSPDRIEASPLRMLTENVSRTGILMRWTADIPLPLLDKAMTLDVQLPENSEFGPRVMRCRGRVVRITPVAGEQPAVAFEVDSMRFVKSRTRKVITDLASMAVVARIV